MEENIKNGSESVCSAHFTACKVLILMSSLDPDWPDSVLPWQHMIGPGSITGRKPEVRDLSQTNYNKETKTADYNKRKTLQCSPTKLNNDS